METRMNIIMFQCLNQVLLLSCKQRYLHKLWCSRILPSSPYIFGTAGGAFFCVSCAFSSVWLCRRCVLFFFASNALFLRCRRFWLYFLSLPLFYHLYALRTTTNFMCFCRTRFAPFFLFIGYMQFYYGFKKIDDAPCSCVKSNSTKKEPTRQNIVRCCRHNRTLANEVNFIVNAVFPLLLLLLLCC